MTMKTVSLMIHTLRLTGAAGILAAALSFGAVPVHAAEAAPSQADIAKSDPGNSQDETAAATSSSTASNDPSGQTDAPAEIRISIDKPVLLLAAGEQAQLHATVESDDSTVTTGVTWSSSDLSVLHVSRTGRVTAVYPGQASIIAYAGDTKVSAKCAVVVYPDGDLAVIAEEQENWTFKAFYRAMANLKGKTSPWRRILCIGDSVTAGVQAGPGLKAWIPNYPLVMSSLLKVPVFNRGVGGSSIWSRGSYSILDSLDHYEDADAIFLMGGYNDWFFGEECPIGDLETPGTFTYDFEALCIRISETWPDADVFVILPPTPHDHMGVEPYYDFSWLKAIERERAEAHGFRVLNLPAEDILNGLEEDTWKTFFSDNVHMNDYGYLVLGSIIADKALQSMEDMPAVVSESVVE
ncbi:MAG: Ig-like domain-containing protein [Lachnospiraceae bacterium]|nr:Ig-like domain-containing protein [Lachnospiraceae bacterium]